MKPEVALELLESAAEQLQVRVSYEVLQTSVVHGGLCRVKGEYRIIVDKRASAEERITTLASALAKLRQRGPITVELSPKVIDLLRMHEPAPARPAGFAAGGRAATGGRTAA